MATPPDKVSGVWISLFYTFLNYTLLYPHKFGGMDTMDKLRFDMTQMDPNRVRVEVLYEGKISMGILYFERAKKTFSTKPIGLNEWACVDARVEGLYTVDSAITPKDIVAHCQQLIKESI